MRLRQLLLPAVLLLFWPPREQIQGPCLHDARVCAANPGVRQRSGAGGGGEGGLYAQRGITWSAGAMSQAGPGGVVACQGHDGRACACQEGIVRRSQRTLSQGVVWRGTRALKIRRQSCSQSPTRRAGHFARKMVWKLMVSKLSWKHKLPIVGDQTAMPYYYAARRRNVHQQKWIPGLRAAFTVSKTNLDIATAE